jgi:aspartate/methionine/tyrosine aminotransferase
MNAAVQTARPAASPFDCLSASLGLWPQQGRRHGRSFIPMSAGVNWSPPGRAVRELLQLELDLSLTSRNYGNAQGLLPVTRVLELVENQCSGQRNAVVTVTHGTTEGAWLAMQAFSRMGAMRPGDAVLAVGHTFPLYHRLAHDFEWRFHECLGHGDSDGRFMPGGARVAEALERIKPRLVCLVLPNNPLGELICPETLAHVLAHVRRHGARLLVDRVCLMPWDDAAHIATAVAPLVSQGQAVLVDSFSKTDSLAGLRTGFLVSDKAIKDHVVALTKSRFLNPPPFGAATLAVTRLAAASARTATRTLSAFAHAQEELFSEYPCAEEFHAFIDAARQQLPALARDAGELRRRVRGNFDALALQFGAIACRPLRLEAGFNVALELPAMHAEREWPDQRELAAVHGVGVLTSGCFCAELTSRRYFVRIGLTLDAADFAQGLQRLQSFYNPMQ